MEDSYQRREQRLKDETDLFIQQNNEKLRILETEKADLQTSHNRKLSVLETAKNNEIETLKDLYRRVLEQFRAEHDEEVAHLRRLNEQEVSAAISADAHTKSLQSLIFFFFFFFYCKTHNTTYILLTHNTTYILT